MRSCTKTRNLPQKMLTGLLEKFGVASATNITPHFVMLFYTAGESFRPDATESVPLDWPGAWA